MNSSLEIMPSPDGVSIHSVVKGNQSHFCFCLHDGSLSVVFSANHTTSLHFVNILYRIGLIIKLLLLPLTLTLTMCGPNLALLSLVLLTLVTLAHSQSPAKVGDQCCLEDWDPNIGSVFLAFKAALMDFTKPGFLKEMGRWVGDRDKYFVEEEPEGVCKGQLSMQCHPTTKRCECSNVGPFRYVQNPGNFCVGGTNNFCSTFFNSIPCKNRYFKCVQNPAWAKGYEFCKLDDNAPKGSEDWIEWGGEMFTAEGRLVDMKGGKGGGTRTTSPSFFILFVILALTLTLTSSLDLFKSESMCHL